MKCGGHAGPFFSILATALLLSACLVIASVAACAPRLTAPAADVAAGAVGGTGYRFLRWKQGLAVMIWYDFRGDSGSSSTSSGGGLGAPSTYTIHGYAESEDGDRFEWEAETSDGETFLIKGDTVLRLGTAAGGRGVTSLKLSDLDWDGTAEVLFTYNFESGIYHSRIGMYAPAYDQERTYEAQTAYLGDVALVKDALTHVMVKAVAPDDETSTLRYGETLGLLVIDQGEDEVELELHVAEGLPDDLLHNLLSISTLPELEPDTSVDSHRGIHFTFDHTIAEQAVAEVAPGPVEGAPSWAAQPAHVQFSFVGYALPTRFPAPRLIVYPVARFEEVNEGAAATVADLRRLLADEPASPETISFLPPFSSSQVMRARVAYVSFREGTGVRFLTQYATPDRPINNQEVFYAFQGLTDDGVTAVSAILPISHTLLPEDPTGYEGNLDALAEDFDAYVSDIEQQLDARDASTFTPDLSLLDAMIQSLEVDRPWMSDLSAPPGE